MLRTKTVATAQSVADCGLDLALLDEIVSWERVPSFEKVGRSGTYELPTPIRMETPRGAVLAYSLKLKGVGLRRHDGRVELPSIEPYYRIHPHLGFTPAGELISIHSQPAPLGGIVLAMARAEFEIANALSFSCPAQIPVRLYAYEEPHLVFRSLASPAPLGAVVSAIPTHSRLRVEDVFGYDQATGGRRVELDQWARSLGVAPGPDVELRLLGRLGALYTRTLRAFHEAGFYRYSGQPDNYALAPERNEVFLIDLDSSRPLAECSTIEAPLQLMRDMASALYGLTVYMLRRENIDRFEPARLRQHNFYLEMLRGYYHDVPLAQLVIAHSQLLTHYQRIYHEAMRRHQLSPVLSFESEALSYDEYRRRKRQQTWIDRDESLCLFLASAWNLHSCSELAGRHPHRRTLDDVLDSMARYATPATASYVRAATCAPALVVARTG